MTDERERLREALVEMLGEVGFMRSCIASGEKLSPDDLARQDAAMARAAALVHDLPMGIRGGDDDEDQYAALAVDRPSGSGLKEAVKHFLEAWPNIVNHPRYDNVEVAALRAALSGSSDPEVDWDEADDMCPNCITPWKCNGPHLSEETAAARRHLGSSDPEARWGTAPAYQAGYEKGWADAKRAASDPEAETIDRLKRALRVATHRPHDQLGEPDEASGFPVCSVCGAIQTSDPEAGGLDEYKEATDAAMNFGGGYHEGLRKAAQYLRVKAELTEKASPNAAYDLRNNADAIEHLSQPEPLHPLDATIRGLMDKLE